MHPPSVEEINTAFREMAAEGQGVWTFQLISPEAALALTARAFAGDPHAARIVMAAEDFIRTLHEVCPPMLCLLCDRELTKKYMPATLVLLHAARDEPATAVFQGVCIKCEAAGDLENRIVARYCEEFMDDIRRIDIASPGRA